MSTTASPSTAPRTTSSRPPSYSSSHEHNRPPPSYNPPSERDRPHRSHSTRVSSSNPPPSPRRSMSSSHHVAPSSPHARPGTGNLQNVQRNDFEQSNLARPPSSRRSDSRDGSGPARSDSRKDGQAHGRTQSRYNEAPTPAPSSQNGRSSNTANPTQNLRRRTTIDATTGHWELGKTIGAGSMGKVKLARNKDTSELVAVKIVPRQSAEGEHRTQAERERADHSKEVRTAREAAIVTLVDHPYICGMRDVVRTNYHWYMLFEYVNGGQMLDYIISHGRLKEKQARKFGRQIASALDYSHRNSIVHRDLKIENILIDKTGDIKIIDFGLSNLFSPRSHLKTFCGSLYFAAPELLNAKQYTGPEVDVWSFGIVLYVLVCGKVPFDDQSMPQLHAKIKKGFVEYPPWLSPECKHLISRMLNTNPAERATLTEIMNHGWLTKGFNGPPESFLPLRTPLALPLDNAVIEKMTGFDFGSPEMISAQLTRIIESEEYQRAVREAERRPVQPPPDPEKKRGVFDFYKRRNSINSRDTLNTPSSEAIQFGRDPVNAFHPLISIYYLAREKIEREMREKNPGGLSMPQDPGEKPLKVPDLPIAPEAAYTNTQTFEMAGEKPTGGRTRPRARTHGEDEVQEGLQNLNVNNAPNPTIVEPEQQQTLQSAKKESTTAGLLRRFSTRRQKGTPDRGEKTGSHPPSSLAAYGNPDTLRKSYSTRRARDNEGSSTALRPDSAHLSAPQDDADGVNEKGSKRTHGLGRSISVNSSDVRRRFTRRGVSEGSSMRPPMSSSNSYDRKASPDPSSRQGAVSDAETDATRMAPSTSAPVHARGQSMQVRRSRRAAVRTSDVPEETDAELQDDEAPSDGVGTGIKPVFLRGIFSVSTTSTRPLPVVRADIIRVLKQLGVEYKEVRGGFSCRHTPSIMPGASGAPATNDEAAAAVPPAGTGHLSPSSPANSPHGRRISFGRLRTTDREDFRRSMHKPGNDTYQSPQPPQSQQQQPVVSEDDSDEDLAPVTPRPTLSSPQQQQQQQAGETTTHVQSDLGGNLTLRFEILIVKVPFLSLHGIQFKKVDGGTWQYKNMAQKILNELRL